MNAAKDPRRSSIVSPRLWAVTAVPLGLLIIASALLFVQVLRMSRAARWVEHAEETIALCADIERHVQRQHAAILAQLLNRANDGLGAPAEAEVRQALRTIRSYIADNQSQLVQLAKLESLYQAWTQHLRELQAFNARSLPYDDQLAEAGVLLTQIVEAVEVLEQDERRLHAQRSEHLNEVQALTIYGVLPVLLLLSLAIGVNSRRQVVRLANDFSEAMRGLDEAKHVVELQSWARDRRVRLIDTTRGDAGVERLGRRMLEELADASGAVVGAFYLMENQTLVRRATYGLGDIGDAKFQLGQGLVGEAARSIEYRNVPDVPDNYMTVTSGVGSGSVRTLAFIPCHHEDEVLAMVELGFLSPISERAQVLFEQAGETLGAAVAVTRKRVWLRTLLEESRKQAEALQAQQEELRVANEELSTQSEALKAAHAQLEERTGELEVSHDEMTRQRDALAEAQTALQQRAIDLKRANRYKSEFLASMSHELRTPLNSALILSKSLADNPTGNLTAEQVRFAQTIHSSGQDLLALLNDVLDLSKIEAGAVELFYTEASLADVVRPVLRITEPIAKERGLELKVALEEPQTTVRTDLQRVQQILKNLLSNACKFTPSGTVTLGARVHDSALIFSVEDTGVGIAEDQREMIFEAFRQGDGTIHRRFSGTGLGLSISRDLAQRLGGDISVESTEGVGSRFTVVLPAQASDKPSARPKESVDEEASGPETHSPVLAEPDSKQLRTDKPQTKTSNVSLPASNQRPLVLMIQNDARFSETIREVVQSLDFEFLVATDADDGLALARARKPAAIVLDFESQTEFELLEQLKSDAKTSRIPVHVVASSNAGAEAVSLGAVGYLQKPVELNKLRSMISRLVDGSAAPRRVLIVEDDVKHREALCDLLALPDVKIVTAGTVTEALTAMQEKTFMCVVIDLVLPDGSGHDLLKALASNEEYSFPNVIIYTGQPLTPQEEQELRRYSDSIILKGPRSPERLLDEVSMFLHQVESTLEPSHRRVPRRARKGDAIFSGKKILLVEDDVRNVFALTSVLERQGMELVVARNGKEALTALQANANVTMILMDIMMPEMDGLEAIRRIRGMDGRLAKLPIIALTAKAMRDDREACLRAGANDYITKPIDVETLLSLMRVWMPR